MRQNKNKVFTILIIILVFILAVEIFVLLLEKQKKEDRVTEVGSSYEEEERSEISYPEPEYQFQTEEIVVEVPGLSREYTVAWVSDLHIVTDHETANNILAEDLAAIKARYNFFQTADGIHGEDLLPDVIDFLNCGEYDGIIFGGDMMDYCSVSNMELLTSEFERLNKQIPVLYIRADHDYGFWYGGDGFTETDAEAMHKTMMDGDDLNTKCLDFGEFVILGVNRSTKDMLPMQYAILDEMFANAASNGKPIIVATHVPYASKIDDTNEVTLYDKSMQIRNKIYYWGGGDYIPNDVTSNFLDKIYREDTNVVQVLAGHLHAGWDGKLTEQVGQHIFEPAFLGSIGIIRFVPEKEGNK
ncbi:MAG: metallophosphoesterase [Lachnospiraceae bacterium]|nr:metallophosphoesterase [Lachnospiraceae bacterium]